MPIISDIVALSLQQFADHVVADAERARLDQTAHPNDQPADRGPPHPVDLKPGEGVLGEVHERRRGDRQQPAAETREHTQELDARADVRCANAQPKHRSRSKQRPAQHRAGAHRGDDRDEAPRPPLEQKQLDREQHRGQRRVERRRHPACGARDEQSLAFVGARVQELCQHRPDGAPGHDDRALRAERPTGADAHRRRDRLQKGDTWLYATLACENRLDRLRHPVTTDAL
jgi:hypothetical protein